MLFILGDRGHQLQPWLMTPVRNPANDGEAAYNRAHIRTRGVIERTFCILKSRFRCLDRSGGALLYSPPKVCRIIVVCCILHNIAIRAGLRVEEHEDNNDSGDEEEEPPAHWLMCGRTRAGVSDSILFRIISSNLF